MHREPRSGFVNLMIVRDSLHYTNTAHTIPLGKGVPDQGSVCLDPTIENDGQLLFGNTILSRHIPSQMKTTEIDKDVIPWANSCTRPCIPRGRDDRLRTVPTRTRNWSGIVRRVRGAGSGP